MGVNKKLNGRPDEKKNEKKGTKQIRTDQGINPSTFPGLKDGVWRRRSIKLLLIKCVKNDIESIIPVTLEVG